MNMPSFPRKRESSETSNARSGQNLGFDLLHLDDLASWIPAFAGMTDSEEYIE